MKMRLLWNHQSRVSLDDEADLIRSSSRFRCCTGNHSSSEFDSIYLPRRLSKEHEDFFKSIL